MNNNILYNAWINFTKLYIIKELTTTIITEDQHIMGLFDPTTKIWYNGWAIVSHSQYSIYYKKSKELLLYGINLENINNEIPNYQKIIIKNILINSKFYINERYTQLYVIIAIISYLMKAVQIFRLKKDKYFIYMCKIK
jgi:hypothetical protein